jgi:proteasome lid subunit RPN8/RPN11
MHPREEECCKSLYAKTEAKISSMCYRCRVAKNIEMDVKEIGYGLMDWTYLAKEWASGWLF